MHSINNIFNKQHIKGKLEKRTHLSISEILILTFTFEVSSLEEGRK